MAKTVTGNVIDLGHAAAVNSTLRFEYASAPALVDGALVASGTSKISKVKVTGEITPVVLTAGYYRVKIDDNPNDIFIILVDSVSESVDIKNIITPSVGTIPTVGANPNASSTVTGGVRTYTNPSPGPAIVYSVAEVNALVAAIFQMVAVAPSGAPASTERAKWDYVAKKLWVNDNGSWRAIVE